MAKEEIKALVPVKDVILDFSCINFIDSMGINAIIQV
jgi:anti-anti-sigma regulatory factor